jgi:hypothetical protein
LNPAGSVINYPEYQNQPISAFITKSVHYYHLREIP